jgi:hypothetical protein
MEFRLVRRVVLPRLLHNAVHRGKIRWASPHAMDENEQMYFLSGLVGHGRDESSRVTPSILIIIGLPAEVTKLPGGDYVRVNVSCGDAVRKPTWSIAAATSWHTLCSGYFPSPRPRLRPRVSDRLALLSTFNLYLTTLTHNSRHGTTPI